ncbi:MAG: hypothetical protein RLZZ628_1124 [Bacteroidota bacterium]|jgi:flagellar motor protein MotB
MNEMRIISFIILFLQIQTCVWAQRMVPILFQTTLNDAPFAHAEITFLDKYYRNAFYEGKMPVPRDEPVGVTDANGTVKMRLPRTRDSKDWEVKRSNRSEIYWEYAFQIRADQVDTNFFDALNIVKLVYVKYIPKIIDNQQVITIPLNLQVNFVRARRTLQRRIDSLEILIERAKWVLHQTNAKLLGNSLSFAMGYYEARTKQLDTLLETDKKRLENYQDTLAKREKYPKTSLSELAKEGKLALKGGRYVVTTSKDGSDTQIASSVAQLEKEIAARSQQIASILEIYEKEINEGLDLAIQTKYEPRQFKVKALSEDNLADVQACVRQLRERYERYAPFLAAKGMKGTIVLEIRGYTDGEKFGTTKPFEIESMNQCADAEKTGNDPENQCLSALRARYLKEYMVSLMPQLPVAAMHQGLGNQLAVQAGDMTPNADFRKCMISTYIKLESVKLN